ncbi:NUDIX hydrolase [Corynebacterium pygosceleis]|uniref:NUDIX hydrolase n=1 Tax=Corynebacterium pygosceleis TaxID=2800406 RepID=UPI0019035E50|nr:NUDIX hydrolase [Corynebacterium pygosceleis]MCL0121264.1 NUDIX hydrolase [Corynebacterium pygosceleis]
MKGDGNGWSAGPRGTRCWGIHGAAGLLLVVDGTDTPGGVGHHPPRILMQHRAGWTADGDTWALPGGARDSHETATEAALRETEEECAIDTDRVEVLGELVTAGPHDADPERPELPGGWTYTTVIARVGQILPTRANRESVELRWVDLDDVTDLNLMPAFAASWTRLRGELHRLTGADL